MLPQVTHFSGAETRTLCSGLGSPFQLPLRVKNWQSDLFFPTSIYILPCSPTHKGWGSTTRHPTGQKSNSRGSHYLHCDLVVMMRKCRILKVESQFNKHLHHCVEPDFCWGPMSSWTHLLSDCKFLWVSHGRWVPNAGWARCKHRRLRWIPYLLFILSLPLSLSLSCVRVHTSSSQCHNVYVNWIFNILQINGFRKNMDTIVCLWVNMIGSASQIGSEKLAGRKEGSDKIITCLPAH